MTIAKVIPITRLPRHINALDYSVPEHLQTDALVGVLVRIPLRNREVFGIIDSLSAIGSPSQNFCATSSFQNIKNIISCLPLRATTHDLELIRWFAVHYGVSRSLPALMMFSPAFAKASADTAIYALRAMLDKSNFAEASTNRKRNVRQPILTRVSSRSEALSLHLSLMQETLDAQEQVLLLCPTIADVAYIIARLPASHNEHAAALHSALSKKKITSELERIAAGKASIIVGTRMACMVKAPLLSAIIIDQSERVDHKNYDMNPRYDARDVALYRAAHKNLACSFISVAPRLEEYYQVTQGQMLFQETSGQTTRTCVNLSDEWKGGNTSVVSEHLQSSIRETLEQRKSVFLFLNRKGGERFVVCKNCKHLIAYLDREEKNNSPLPLNCGECGSMASISKGIGTKTLVRDMQKLFSRTQCIELSRDTSVKKSKGINIPLSLDKPTIIVGTSLVAIGYPELFSSFGLVAIVLADPIMTSIDFRAQETQWQTLQHIFSLARSYGSEILIQYFQPDTPFIRSLRQNDYRTFAEQELKNRKTFSWPPYSKIIALKVRGSASLSDLEEQCSNALRSFIDGKQVSIAKSARRPNTLEIQVFEEWDHSELYDAIKPFFNALPPYVVIDVDTL